MASITRENWGSLDISTKLGKGVVAAGLIGGGLIASQGILAMGVLVISSEIIAAMIEKPWNRDTSPQIATAAKIQHFVSRQFWASVIRAVVFFSIVPVAGWWSAKALFKINSILSPSILKTVAFAFVTLRSLIYAVKNANRADRIEENPYYYQKDLSMIYSIIGMVQNENLQTIPLELRPILHEILKVAGKGKLSGKFIELQRSLEIAREQEEVLSPRLIAALLQIYKEYGYQNIDRQFVRNNILGKYPDVKKGDLCKHLLPLVVYQGIGDFILLTPIFDLKTLCAYLSDIQFQTYFEVNRVTDTVQKIPQWREKIVQQDWSLLESDILHLFKKGPDNLIPYDRLLWLRDLLSNSQEVAAHPKLVKIKDQVIEVLDFIEHLYPSLDSCKEVCATLDGEQFRSYFQLEVLSRVEKMIELLRISKMQNFKDFGIEMGSNKVLRSLDNILTRILVRTETLPQQLDDKLSQIQAERLASLIVHRERALKLREELVELFPILDDCTIEDYELESGTYFDLATTDGRIPNLDKEILKRALYRLRNLPPIPEDQNNPKKWAIAVLHDRKEMAEEDLLYLEDSDID